MFHFHNSDRMSSKVVCVVGGGISGLAAAQTLVYMSRKRLYPLDVVLLESTARLGGQIRTERFDNLTKVNSRVIIEAGAEGFVTRSTVFPKLGGMAGLGDDQIVDQKRIIDRELRFDPEKRSWGILELAPGVAAQKLGFQVPKEDRGRGIRSFRTGMSQLVEQISSNLEDVRLNSAVTGLSRGDRLGYHLRIQGYTGRNPIQCSYSGMSLNSHAVPIGPPKSSRKLPGDGL